MSNKQLQQQLKLLIQQFLLSIKVDQKYLIQSQLQLNRILDQCLHKTQLINQSSFVTQQKCDIINQKLSRIPKLQTRIQGLSKLFYQAHKRIEVINKNMGNLEKIELLQAQLQGRTVINKQQQKIESYQINIKGKNGEKYIQKQKVQGDNGNK